MNKIVLGLCSMYLLKVSLLCFLVIAITCLPAIMLACQFYYCFQ